MEGLKIAHSKYISNRSEQVWEPDIPEGAILYGRNALALLLNTKYGEKILLRPPAEIAIPSSKFESMYKGLLPKTRDDRRPPRVTEGSVVEVGSFSLRIVNDDVLKQLPTEKVGKHEVMVTSIEVSAACMFSILSQHRIFSTTSIRDAGRLLEVLRHHLGTKEPIPTLTREALPKDCYYTGKYALGLSDRAEIASFGDTSKAIRELLERGYESYDIAFSWNEQLIPSTLYIAADGALPPLTVYDFSLMCSNANGAGSLGILGIGVVSPLDALAHLGEVGKESVGTCLYGNYIYEMATANYVSRADYISMRQFLLAAIRSEEKSKRE